MGMRGTRCSDIECHAPAFRYTPSGPLICTEDTHLSREEDSTQSTGADQVGASEKGL